MFVEFFTSDMKICAYNTMDVFHLHLFSALTQDGLPVIDKQSLLSVVNKHYLLAVLTWDGLPAVLLSVESSPTVLTKDGFTIEPWMVYLIINKNGFVAVIIMND
jgi:hypothetical protein